MFEPGYQIERLPYNLGLLKTLDILWGYLVLIFCAQLVKMIAENVNHANLIRVAVASVSGILDLLYNKILLISESTRSTSAQGNLVNLLYTDSQKVQQII